MGKTQSKRSVDITTEGKKSADDEITGKLEKIEDVDQRKQGNGETSQESNEHEKKIDTEEPENDKDLTTEKSAESHENTENVEAAIDTTKDILPVNEEISPLNDDSAKKSKKEKVKKKWSFRSISFGKKDKQKPNKSEETTEEIMANGEAEKSETVVEQKQEASKDSGAAGDADTKLDTKIVLSEINTEVKLTPTKKSPEVDVGISAAICATVEEVSEPTNMTDLTTEKQTDEQIIASTVEVITSNVLNTEDKKIETTSTEKITATTNDNCASSELIKEVISKEIIKNENNGCDGEKPQENGTIEDQQTKTIIEVNTDIASEEPIRSDPTVPTVIEENVVAVDNDNNQNEINQVNLCDNSVKNIVQNDSLPPPLPCSPPPSQVSVFAFSNNTESDVSTSKAVLNSLETSIAESPPNDELNLLINTNENEKKNDNIKETTVHIVISNESENKENTGFSQDELLDSASTLEELICIKHDPSPANLVDINCTKESQEVNAVDKESEKEEIAATIVKEITETAVMLCQQQIKENDEYSNKENNENEDKDCVINSPSIDSALINDTKETLIEICKELQIEANTLSGQEDCLLEQIVQLKLSDDELRNDSEIIKDLSKTENAPEVTTQELTVSCE